MAHPHQPYWLWAGSISCGLGVALVGVNAVLDTARAHYMFWTSLPMILAYVAFALGFTCFGCAIREVRFPWAIGRSPVRGGADRIRPADTGPPANTSAYDDVAGRDNQGSAPRVFSDKRILTYDSPKEITALFKSHTSAQAHKLLEPYYNQWLRVEGKLGDVGPWADSFSRVVLRRAFRSPGINMHFTDRQVYGNRLTVLRPGRRVVVVGKITKITASSITITDCELVE